jgi:hypothetical protein
MDVCVMCFTYRQKANCRIIKKNNQVRMKYRAQENTKKSRWRRGCLCLLSVVCCLVMSLRRADPSSRRVLPTVLCHCLWSENFKNEAALARIGLLRHREKKLVFLNQTRYVDWNTYMYEKKGGRKKGSDSSANIGACLNWRMHLTGPRYWARYRCMVTALNSTCVIWSGECNSTCPNGRRLLRYDR